MYIPVTSLGDDRRIVVVGYYSHGVLCAIIEDSEHKTSCICIDGRASSLTRNRLFDGARHPSKPDARLIDLGAPEEGIVVSLLSHWLDEEAPKGKITDEGIEIMKKILLHLGDSD